MRRGYYRQPTKLKEGNVFSHVCLFTGRSQVTIIRDALDPIIKEPHPPLGPHCKGTPPPDMKPHCAGTLVLTSGGY